MGPHTSVTLQLPLVDPDAAPLVLYSSGVSGIRF